VRLHRHDHHADGLRRLRCRVIAAIRRAGTRFSVTVPVNASVRAAIAAIGEDTWTGHALRSDCSPSTTLSTHLHRDRMSQVQSSRPERESRHDRIVGGPAIDWPRY
jgi:hypothetical protein